MYIPKLVTYFVTMNLTFRLIEEKADKSGLCPVFVDFTYSGKRLRYFTGEKCKPSDWDSKKMKFKRSFDGYLSANDFLENLSAKLHSAYRSFISNGVVPLPSQLRETLKPREVVKVKTLVQDFEAFISEKRKVVVSVDSYNATLGRLMRFESKVGKFFPSDYTQKFHDSFVEHMLDYGLHPNSIAKSSGHLKEYFKFIKKTDNLPEFITSEIEPDIIFLTVSNLEKIQKVELELSLSRVRDMFLFSCFTGLRYGDLRRLIPSQITDKGSYSIIELVPNKSRSRLKAAKRIEIPLLSGALEILEKYAGALTSLPVISNQKMNKYLKTIGELAGISEKCQVIEYQKGFPVTKVYPKFELITVHVARHTFATLSLVKGVPLEIIQKVLGHSDIRTTMRYAKIVDAYKNAVILDAWKG